MTTVVCSRLNPDYKSLKYPTNPKHVKCAKILLEAKANPHCKAYDGKTVLHTAAELNDAESIQLLLNAKADLSGTDESVLHHVGGVEACRLLLANGADPNATRNTAEKRNVTPLFNANAEIAEVLLEHGAILDFQDREGRTPLMHVLELLDRLAQKYGNAYSDRKEDELAALAELLVRRGASLTAKTVYYNWTPMRYVLVLKTSQNPVFNNVAKVIEEAAQKNL